MFNPTAEYWAAKLNGIRLAIQRTEAEIPKLIEARQIEAHKSQALMYKKSLAVNQERYRSWRNKRQNLERAQ